MKSPEMMQLNPWGGYAKIKDHLKVAHKISKADMAKYMSLCLNFCPESLRSLGG